MSNYDKPVGVAILTNANRLPYLKYAIQTFLRNCAYRPLIFGIFDNGSTDETPEFCRRLSSVGDKYHNIQYRCQRSETDLGCAPGVNRANDLVRDCEFSLFQESDYLHLDPEESGVPREWMNSAIEFMLSGKCDYLYLRRYRCWEEAQGLYWPEAVHQTGDKEGWFLHSPKQIYTNNPHLRLTQSLFDSGTLPLQEFYGKNGEPIDFKSSKEIWARAEHLAKPPRRSCYAAWGMFIHESKPTPWKDLNPVGCGKGSFGCSTCKYGFLEFRQGFCDWCDGTKDFHDLAHHSLRYKEYTQITAPIIAELQSRFTPCVPFGFSPGCARQQDTFL